MKPEKIRENYLEKDYNCAETILRTANEEYNLGLDEDAMKLVSGFGAGFGCGSTCGALCGATAVIGNMFVGERAHATEGFKDHCAEFYQMFEQKLGSTNCQELMDKYKTPEVRCLHTVEMAAQTLDEYLKAKGKIETDEEEVTVSEEDIKRVKALGFLHNKGTNKFNGRIITRNGKINANEQRVIAEAAAKFGDGQIAMTTRLTIEVIGIPYENIEPFREYLLKEAGLETGGTGSKVRPVVSCKGTTCQYGLCDTYALSEEIHQRFYKGYFNVKLPHKFKIAVGGCPNNCVKPDLNDIGIIGQRIPGYQEDLCKGCKTCSVENSCPVKASKVEDGKMVISEEECNNCGRCIGKCPFDAASDGTYGFKVVIGGRWGKRSAHGIPLSKVFTTKEEMLSVIEKAILLFREQGKTGERFSDTIARIGFENVEKQLLSDDILERKDEIIGAQLHLVGGATC